MDFSSPGYSSFRAGHGPDHRVDMSLDDIKLQEDRQSMMERERHGPGPVRDGRGFGHGARGGPPPYGRGPPPGSDKSKRVYVGNLPYRITWQNLKDELRKMNFEVVFAEVCTDDRGQSKGYGVVELRSAEDAQEVIRKLDGYEWDGRRLTAHEDRVDGFPRRGPPKMGPPPRAGSRGHDHGGPPGGGGDEFAGRQSSALQQLQHLNQLAALLTAGAMGQAMTENSAGSGGGDDAHNCSIFVSNVDYGITWQRLKDMFRQAGNVRRVDLKQEANGRSKGSAIVDFELPHEAKNAIQMFNGFILNGRPLRCAFFRPRPGAPESTPPPQAPAAGNSNPLQLLQTLNSLAVLQQIVSGNTSNPDPGHSQPGPSSGRRSPPYHRHDPGRRDRPPPDRGYSRPPHDHDHYRNRPPPFEPRQIFVRNLPWSMGWQEVRDLFNEAVGNVTHVDVVRDADGRSKGRGTVEFHSIDDCYRAIDKLNGHPVHGRRIEVRIDQFQ